jgi:hypothetical protein
MRRPVDGLNIRSSIRNVPMIADFRTPLQTAGRLNGNSNCIDTMPFPVYIKSV